MLSLPLLAKSQSTISVSGFVADAQTRELLSGATIWETATLKGVISNHSGFFRIQGGVDSLSISVSFIGYKTTSFTFVRDSVLTVFLEPSPIQGAGVLVEGKTIPKHRSPRLSVTQITSQEITSLPGYMGQNDVMKAIQFYPGIQQGFEGTAGLYVRGGGIDQTEILLDGFPIYNPFHSGGFISAFHAASIQNVTMYTGVAPSEYGGRLGGYMDISLKDGNRKRWTGDIGLGLISGESHIEGPLTENISMQFSGRINTFNNYIGILDWEEKDVIPENDFYDGLLKFSWQINKNNTVRLLLFTTSDELRNDVFAQSSDTLGSTIVNSDYSIGYATRWNNQLVGVNWLSTAWKNVLIKQNAYVNRYEYSSSDGLESTISENNVQTSQQAFKNSSLSAIQDIGYHFSFQFIPSNSHSVTLGGGVKNQSFKINSQLVRTQEVIFDSDDFSQENRTYAYSFAEWEWNPVPAWAIVAGGRVESYSLKDENFVEFSPRFSVRRLLSESSSVKLGYMHSHQFMHLLSNSTFGVQNDIWIPSGEGIAPASAHSFSVGFTKVTNALEFTWETYYRTMNSVADYLYGSNFYALNTPWQERLEQGTGTAYGAEWMIRKRRGRFFGFLGYTLSWSNRQFEIINNGNEFPYKYDRRHNFTVNGNYQASKNMSFSATWIFMSGYRVTVPDIRMLSETWFPEGYAIDIISTSNRNNQKIGDYHRLDVSANYTKTTAWGNAKATFGLYNAYGRLNQSSWSYDGLTEDRSKVRVLVFYLFPIQPFATISVGF